MLNNRPKSSHHLLCPSTVSLRVPLNKKENVATPRHAVFCPRSAPESRGVVSLSYMMWRSNFGCQQWQNEAPWDWQLKEKTKQQTRWIEWMRKCFLNSSNYSGYVYVSAFNTKLTQLPGGLGYQFNAMPGLTFVTVEHHAEQATWWHYHVLWSLALDFHDYFAFGVLWSSITIIYQFAKIGHRYLPSI